MTRLTLPYSKVRADLAILDNYHPEQIKARYSVSLSQGIIDRNWHTNKLERFQPDLKTYAAIAILATATCGQPLVPFDALLKFRILRRNREDTQALSPLQYDQRFLQGRGCNVLFVAGR
jgi:hypothetical protein